MTTKLKDLQTQLDALKAEKAAAESKFDDQIRVVAREMESIRLAAYPHKVGDVIDYHGTPAKIVRIHAYTDDIIPTVVTKLPSGGWSKRERMMFNWDSGDDE